MMELRFVNLCRLLFLLSGVVCADLDVLAINTKPAPFSGFIQACCYSECLSVLFLSYAIVMSSSSRWKCLLVA